jgi:hypothetical protein
MTLIGRSTPYLEILNNPDKHPNDYKKLQEHGAMAFGLASLDNKLKNYKQAAYSRLTWPALLAKHFNADYICHAFGGCGNQAINRNVVRFINQFNADDLIIINWTYKSRWDVIDVNEPYPRDYWKTVSPGTVNKYPEFTKFYLSHLQSDIWDNWISLNEMLLAATLLKSRNLNFIMTSIERHDTKFVPAIEYIDVARELIADDITWFDDLGFVDWSNRNGFPIGADGHPLDEAHQAAFEYLKKKCF